MHALRTSWYRQPMPWLVLASLALHAALITWQTPWRVVPPELASRSGALSVQISAIRTPARETSQTAQATHKTQTADKVDHQTKTQTTNGPVSVKRTATRQASRETGKTAVSAAQSAPGPARSASSPTKAEIASHARTKPEPAETTPSNAIAREHSLQTNSTAVLNDIRDALRQHFFYPRLARLRNWEGDVLVGFQINPDGMIDDVHVLESSGRSVLDQAALHALRSVQQIAYNQPRSLELQLPVTYRLR